MKHFEASFDSSTPAAGPTAPVDPILTHNRQVADTGQKFAWVVGGGYHFKLPVGLTLRCVGTQAMGHTLTTLEAGINIRF
jgi:hypothetical protein